MNDGRCVLRGILAMSLALAALGCESTFEIEDRPIPFSETRQQATLEYIAQHYGGSPEEISITPRIVVLHWMAIDSLEVSLKAFEPELLTKERDDLGSGGRVNVSVHFLVDYDGTVYRLMPENWMARHVIGLNLSAIGVENVGGGDEIDNLTDAQVEANVRLVRYLAEKYPSIDYLIGHSEYRAFEGHPLWLEQDEDYRTDKPDPGRRFMREVRLAVADLGLRGPQKIRAEARRP